jgi:hypothetical protein
VPEGDHVTATVYDVNWLPVNFPGGVTNAYKLTQAQVNANPSAKEAQDNVFLANALLASRFPSAVPKLPTSVRVVIDWPFSFPNAMHNYIAPNTWLRFYGPDADVFSMGKTLSVVTHEYVHGFSRQEIGENVDQSRYEVGAIRESFSDIMATVTDIANGAGGGSGSATWVVGHGMYRSDPSHGIRSLKSPKLDLRADSNLGQVDWYPDFVMLGANHANSSIVSHAYYLLVHGGLHSRAGMPSIFGLNPIPAIPVPALGEVKARKIFMLGYQNFLMDIEPNIPKMKLAAINAAGQLYGPAEIEAVETAFRAVGVCGVGTTAPASMSLTSLGDIMCAGRFFPTWNFLTGAHRYYGEVAPAAFGFALATPVTDINGNHCNFQVSQDSVFRIRACNDCGCGPWSQTYNLTFWSPCP